MYGGKAGELGVSASWRQLTLCHWLLSITRRGERKGAHTHTQVTDAVYVGLGKVLTISGRTIKPEAQASPEAAKAAEAALDSLLAKVCTPWGLPLA